MTYIFDHFLIYIMYLLVKIIENIGKIMALTTEVKWLVHTPKYV